jgi:calcineurin-like phosphoesterase family protein
MRGKLRRPRAGLPIVAASGSTIRLEFDSPPLASVRAALTSSADTPVSAAREFPLTLRPVASCALSTVEAIAEAPPGTYDLVITSDTDEPARFHQAVWLRAQDPAVQPCARVAHITDLHIGSGERTTQRFARVLAEVNCLDVDLVLVTGDIVNNADRWEQLEDARRRLYDLNAPTFVVAGNHDHGFTAAAFLGRKGRGWRNFADTFHPHPLFDFTVANWDFIGFDSGPSLLSPLVRTHSPSDETFAAIEKSLDRAHRLGRAGVVLFSHSPSRARLTGTHASRLRGLVGSMRGGSTLERMLLRAAARGQRVLHLTGHTHWTDLYEVPTERCDAFVRWDHALFERGPQTIRGNVALIGTQSATHSGLPGRGNASGYGFSLLTLNRDAPILEVRRFT